MSKVPEHRHFEFVIGIVMAFLWIALLAWVVQDNEHRLDRIEDTCPCAVEEEEE